MDSTSHLCAKAMLENLLENLFGRNYDMENKVLLFTQMSVLRQLITTESGKFDIILSGLAEGPKTICYIRL
jgi:hypothetical protein